MESRLLCVFDELGLFIDNTEYNEILDIDSITFISLVAKVEDEFNINIPDEKFSFDKLSSFNDFLKIVNELINITALT